MADQPTSADRLAREHTAQAIKTIADMMTDVFAKPADRLRAAELILDRGHGKATQAIIALPAKGAAAQRLAQLTTEKIMELIEASGGMAALAARHAIEGEFVELPAPSPTPAAPDDGSDLL